MGEIRVQLVGGPTALLEYGGLRFLTDPTFDPPGDYEPRPGVSMSKRRGPAVAPEELPAIDAVLLSHDHHVDNLDLSGREFVHHAPLALTTVSGAERLGPPAHGLAPWESWELRRPDGEAVAVTAVPAQHGPDGTTHLSGDVIGFYLSSRGLPTVYLSGDNASVDVVRTIARRLGSAPIAVLFTGGAQMPYMGDAYLTLSARRAAKVARILGARHVVPVHFEGWAHFTQGVGELQDAFERARLADRLRIPERGETLALESGRSLRMAIVGGTGTIGSALAREAFARGHAVSVISRHATPFALDATPFALDATLDELAPVLEGVDVLVGAVGGRPEHVPVAADRLLSAAEQAGVPRLLWVGGAGSLEVVPGLRLVDTPDFPKAIKPGALAQAYALDVLRDGETDVDWSYFSPPADLEVDGDGGEPWSVSAGDGLIRDEDGRSRVTLVDYARAALDEIERPRFTRQRFTIAANAVASSPAHAELAPAGTP